MKKLLIDVSEHQGKIDWEKVKPQIAGAILRCGYGSNYKKQDDAQFKRNADECTRLGIPFGVYLYSYAKTAAQAKSEAAHVLRLVEGYKLAYPVYLDLEQTGTQDGAVERARVFGEIIEKAGYWCGVYANLDWWDNYLPGLDDYTKWVAQYNNECEYTGSHLDIWQYSDKGKVDGIDGNVDMNECYRDLPAEILGSVKPAEKPVEKPAAKPAEKPAAPAAPAAKAEGKTDYAEDFNKAKAGTYKVTASSGLNLRRGASTSKPVIEVLPKGTKVSCYGYYTGAWLYVQTAGGVTGFCHSDYLTKA